MTKTMAASYREILDRIKRVQAESPLAAKQVRLLAVSKFQPVEHIGELLALGHRTFGENRVQEAAEKWPHLRREFPDIALHGIGPLQTNKVKEALQLFDVIEVLDRPKLAESLAHHWGMPGRRTQALYIQVNTGEEPQKAGILPQEADDFIRWCRGDKQLPVEGLMCIPPADVPPAPHFALLHEIARRHALPERSMGMSGDFATAVQLGSTEVRVGSALFGERA